MNFKALLQNFIFSTAVLAGISIVLSCSAMTKTSEYLPSRAPSMTEQDDNHKHCLRPNNIEISQLDLSNEWEQRIEKFLNFKGTGIYVTAPCVQTDTGKLIYFHSIEFGVHRGEAFLKLFPQWKRNTELLNFLGELIDKKAPFFIADTQNIGYLAVVIANHPAYPSAQELVKQSCIDADFIIYLQPSATDDVLVHEARHWLDTNNKLFYNKFKAIFETNKLYLKSTTKNKTQEAFDAYEKGLWEWRGYSEQIKYLRSKNARLSEDEVHENTQKFMQEYWPALRGQLVNLKNSNKKAFDTTIQFMLEMEIEKTPKELSFQTLFGALTK